MTREQACIAIVEQTGKAMIDLDRETMDQAGPDVQDLPGYIGTRSRLQRNPARVTDLSNHRQAISGAGPVVVPGSESRTAAARLRSTPP